MSGANLTRLAGAAQASYRPHPDGTSAADHPAALMAAMASAALDDAGIDPSRVDAVACVEPLSWTYDDLAGTVATALGCRPDVEHRWVPAGGTSPSDLLHQLAAAMADGELDCAVITGAEAMRTRRRAAREHRDPAGWPARAVDVDPMRGQGRLSSDLERRHGLRAPIHVFPLYENAIRTARGRSAEEQLAVAAGLLARNARVAVDNPNAWFRDGPTAEAIAAMGPDNRPIAHPYPKRMNAIMEVDQAAAVVVVSERFASAADAPPGLVDRSPVVLGGCGAEDAWFTVERQTYRESPAMNRAVELALERAGVEAADIDAFDLYSCFPSAIQLALTALGTDHLDPRPLSLTGGLAYAGGPGNAYVLHSLATAVEHLRGHPDQRVLVTGIGMANTKQTATVLGGPGPSDRWPADAGHTSYREPIDTGSRPVTEEASGPATVATWTIEYDREARPSEAILVLDLDDGTRTVANAADTPALVEALLAEDPIGRTGTVEHDATDRRNRFRFA